MKLSSLVEIARKIESTLRVSAPGTIDEMHARLQSVAGHCENPQEAVRAIAEQIYDHPINGDYPALDRLLLDIAAAENLNSWNLPQDIAIEDRTK